MNRLGLYRTISRPFIVLCVALALAESWANAAIDIYTYQAQKHDLYYTGTSPARSFIGDAYNWSGYGRIPDPNVDPQGMPKTAWKHVTMITDTWFIAAFHNHPTRDWDDQTNQAPPPTTFPVPKVRFYPSGNPNGAPFETTIAFQTGNNQYDIRRVGSTDLVVGRLEAAPPTWVRRYPILKRPEGFNYVGLDRVPAEIFVVGQAATDGYVNTRVGRNELGNTILRSTFDSQHGGVGYGFTYDPGAGLGADESRNNPGDSGAPSFAVTPSGLAITGIHGAINTAPATVTWDTSVSLYADQIRATLPDTERPRLSIISDLPADLDADFDVDSADFNILAANFDNPTPTVAQGDIDGNGDVNSADFNVLAIAYNSGETLRSPADFNLDWDVDSDDLRIIGDNWDATVANGTNGDVNGNGHVYEEDITAFNKYFSFFDLTPPPLNSHPRITSGDTNGDGLRMSNDYSLITQHFGQGGFTPYTNGDMDGDMDVDSSDHAAWVAIYNTFGFDFAGPGDLDKDGRSWNSDIETLLGNLGMSGADFEDGDIDGNNVVNDDDFEIFADYWGRGIQSADFPLNPIQVPEPISAVLAVITGLAVALRRRSGLLN
jgi:hypothetical protein